jgi:hypothetical protein
VAEFEKIIHSENDLKETRMHIDHIMAELDVLELDQARLARMFSHYNTNWADYYGTDKTFIIE